MKVAARFGLQPPAAGVCADCACLSLLLLLLRGDYAVPLLLIRRVPLPCDLLTVHHA